MMRFPIVSCLVLGLPAALCAQQPERYTLDEGPAAVYNLVGTLRIEPGEGAVVVQVTRAGADAAQLKIGQGDIDGRSTLRVVYPSDRVRSGSIRSNGSTQLRVRDDGTFGDHDQYQHGHTDHHRWEEGRRVTISDGTEGLDARADLLVRMPKGAQLAVYLAIGSVTVTNVDGELRSTRTARRSPPPGLGARSA